MKKGSPAKSRSVKKAEEAIKRVMSSPWKRVIPPEPKHYTYTPAFKAFPGKSIDEVIQPFVDICVERIEKVLTMWAGGK